MWLNTRNQFKKFTDFSIYYQQLIIWDRKIYTYNDSVMREMFLVKHCKGKKVCLVAKLHIKLNILDLLFSICLWTRKFRIIGQLISIPLWWSELVVYIQSHTALCLEEALNPVICAYELSVPQCFLEEINNAADGNTGWMQLRQAELATTKTQHWKLPKPQLGWLVSAMVDNKIPGKSNSLRVFWWMTFNP